MSNSRTFCQRFLLGVLIGAVFIVLISRHFSENSLPRTFDFRSYGAVQMFNGNGDGDTKSVETEGVSVALRHPEDRGEFDHTFPQFTNREEADSNVIAAGMKLINVTLDPEVDRKLHENRLEPIQYLQHYKNPCWYEALPEEDDPYKNNVFSKLMSANVNSAFNTMRRVFDGRRSNSSGWRIRCVPYFFIPGVSKCGTTDLYDVLSKHPEVARGPVKEPVYWNRIRWETFQDGIGWLPRVMHKVSHIPNPKPFRDYVDLYDKAAEKISSMTRAGNSVSGETEEFHYAITGDGTPSYVYDFDGWVKIPVNKGLDAPKYTIADDIRQINPDAKIIMIFREPADRLFSDYKYFGTRELFHNHPRSKDDFHERAAIGIKLMRECLSARSVRSCLYDRSLTGPSMPVRVRIGMYEPFLQDWFKVFPRENFYVTRLKDYAEDKVKVVTDMYKFLDLEVLPVDTERKAKNKSGSYSSLDGGMRNDTRAMINDFYNEWNQKLATLLQDDRFLWNAA